MVQLIKDNWSLKVKIMFNLVELKSNKAVTTSTKVAKYFKKEHSKVISEIEKLDCSKTFKNENFFKHTGKDNIYFTMTKDGFTFLVMGYTGKKASKFKEEYIKAFNRMEFLLYDKNTTRYKEARSYDRITQKTEMDKMKSSISNISPKLYMKANTIADKAISIKFGYPKMIKKSEMTSDMLVERGTILSNITSLMIAQSLGVAIDSISNVIYNSIQPQLKSK